MKVIVMGAGAIGTATAWYLNRAGHEGTLDWTHGCGSGRALADIISGRRQEVDFAFCGIDAAAPPICTQSAIA